MNAEEAQKLTQRSIKRIEKKKKADEQAYLAIERAIKDLDEPEVLKERDRLLTDLAYEKLLVRFEEDVKRFASSGINKFEFAWKGSRIIESWDRPWIKNNNNFNYNDPQYLALRRLKKYAEDLGYTVKENEHYDSDHDYEIYHGFIFSW